MSAEPDAGTPAPGGVLRVDDTMLELWPLPELGAGKHARGVVLVVGGDDGTAGAVRLAGEAALRAGAGKLQLACARAVAPALQAAVPEALVHGGLDPADLAGHVEQADVVLVGPGLAHLDAARALVTALAPSVRGQLVLDALALSAARDVQAQVLTPNPEELAACLRVDSCPDLAAAAASLAGQTGAVVSVGGEGTWTACPDGRCWHDGSGTRGLGVSGSGDVRAGAVAGLLARGAAPEQAAVWGGWMHGRAGERLGAAGYLAREVAAELGRVAGAIALGGAQRWRSGVPT